MKDEVSCLIHVEDKAIVSWTVPVNSYEESQGQVLAPLSYYICPRHWKSITPDTEAKK